MSERKKWSPKDTLCWECGRTGTTCPWIADNKPVEGWEIVKDPHLYGAEGLFVVSCPLYEKYEPKKKNLYFSCLGCKQFTEYFHVVPERGKYYRGYCKRFRKSIVNPELRGKRCRTWDGREEGMP